MNKAYVIYDSVRDKYVSRTTKIRRPTTPFLAIKFGDIYSAIVFDDFFLAQDRVDEIYSWFFKNYPEKKMNLSVRRLYV